MSSRPYPGESRVGRHPGSLARYRLDIALRVLAASGGAYTLAAFCAHWLALLLPMARVDAVLTASMLAFVIFTIAAMWSFRCASQFRLWTVLLVPIAILWAAARFAT